MLPQREVDMPWAEGTPHNNESEGSFLTNSSFPYPPLAHQTWLLGAELLTQTIRKKLPDLLHLKQIFWPQQVYKMGITDLINTL